MALLPACRVSGRRFVERARAVLVKIASRDRLGDPHGGRRPGELQGRDAVASPEVLGQRALVVEAAGRGDRGDRDPAPQVPADRTRVVSGKSVSERVELGGRRINKKKNNK